MLSLSRYWYFISFIFLSFTRLDPLLAVLDVRLGTHTGKIKTLSLLSRSMLGWHLTRRTWSTVSYLTSRPSIVSSTLWLIQKRRWTSGFTPSVKSVALTPLMMVSNFFLCAILHDRLNYTIHSIVFLLYVVHMVVIIQYSLDLAWFWHQTCERHI